MKGLQLPLGVELAQAASFDTFHAGPNADAVAAVRGAIKGDAPLTFLYGPAASGKSHLLQALAREAARSSRCAYVPLRAQARELPADVVEGLEDCALVCLDDLEAALTPGSPWPLPLLRLLDGLRAHGGRAVIAAAAAPERLDIALPDLRTRLLAAARYGLRPFGDEDRAALLAARARDRGLDLPADAARLLLERLPRDTGSLLGALEDIDRALLSARRKLSLAFVQQWLKQA